MNTEQRVVPFPDEGLGNSSYLVDCGQGTALIIDPVRDIAPYLDEARRRNLKVAYAVETHLHADFISGSPELAAHGVGVVASEGAHLEVEHRGVHEGDEIVAGDVTIRALATPGHTPEHLSYLILERENPIALFSGGALLPGTVARTDLISPDQTESLARALHRSVRASFRSLPDEVTVYPTHGGGSFCSAATGEQRATTIGRERTSNPVFRQDEASFVTDLLSGYGSFPSYFLRLRAVNRSRAQVKAEPPLVRLSIESAQKALAGGAELVDVRPIKQWAAAHLPGSLSIELRPAFASWLGWLVDPERPLLFVLNEQQDRDELVRECLKIGYENLAGEIDGGAEAWLAAGLSLESIPTAPAAHPPTTVLDVRQDDEYATGHVPGALHIELGDLPTKAGEVANHAVSVMCGHGQRAATGASLLLKHGDKQVTLLLGGPENWSRATGRPLEAQA